MFTVQFVSFYRLKNIVIEEEQRKKNRYVEHDFFPKSGTNTKTGINAAGRKASMMKPKESIETYYSEKNYHTSLETTTIYSTKLLFNTYSCLYSFISLKIHIYRFSFLVPDVTRLSFEFLLYLIISQNP
jgi:hypothetical protein